MKWSTATYTKPFGKESNVISHAARSVDTFFILNKIAVSPDNVKA